MNDEWKEIGGGGSGETWTPEKDGDSIIGLYVGKKENVGPNKSMLYQLEIEGTDGTTGVWGSKVLDDKFEQVKEGSLVKIVYLGKVKGANSTYKDYQMFVKEPENWADEAKATVDAQGAMDKDTESEG